MNVLRLPGRLLSLWGEPSDEEHLHPGGALVAAGRQRVRCDACPFLAEVLGRVCRTLRLEGSSPGGGWRRRSPAGRDFCPLRCSGKGFTRSHAERLRRRRRVRQDGRLQQQGRHHERQRRLGEPCMLRGVQHDRTSAFDARTSTSSTTCGCATLRRQSASQRMSPLVAERLNGRCIASTRCPSRPVGHGSSREDHAAETPFAERLQNPGPFHPGGHPGGHGPRGSPAPPRRQVRAPSPWRTMTRAGASGARERQGRRGNAQQSVETLVTGAWRLGHPQ